MSLKSLKETALKNLAVRREQDALERALELTGHTLDDVSAAQVLTTQDIAYPVVIEPDGDGWVASFPDIPEATDS